MRLSKIILALSSSVLLSTSSFHVQAAQDSDSESEIEEIKVTGTRQAYQGDFTALELLLTKKSWMLQVHLISIKL